MPGFTYYDRHPETFKLLRSKFKCDERERERERERHPQHSGLINSLMSSVIFPNTQKYRIHFHGSSAFGARPRRRRSISARYFNLQPPPPPIHAASSLGTSSPQHTHRHTGRMIITCLYGSPLYLLYCLFRLNWPERNTLIIIDAKMLLIFALTDVLCVLL